MSQPIQITSRIRLREFDPDDCGGLKKAETREKTRKLCERIGELQHQLYANATHSLIILLQGMDGSGKDGTGARVLEFVTPAGVQATNFKAPSAEESAHDFLWRAHKAVPRYGCIGLFNRSHYEDVLIVRVLALQPEKVWRARYAQINAFERLLQDNRVLLLKFFLHISKEEQAERLQARIDDPTKRWKFNAVDIEERKLWGGYQKAYEDALEKTSTRWAPWIVVPSDKKWLRNYVVAKTIVDALEDFRMEYPKPDLEGVKIG